jgi:hypothetical protein
MQELSESKKYLGAQIGITSILHTWGQNLCYHPHVHCILPGGGIDSIGKWKPSSQKFFLPVRVLSRLFRGKFLYHLAKARLEFHGDLEFLSDPFKWKDYKDNCKWKVMTIPAEEFIRRFLMHILPYRFMKIRHYGFLGNRGKVQRLKICKSLTNTPILPRLKLTTAQLIQKLTGVDPTRC